MRTESNWQTTSPVVAQASTIRRAILTRKVAAALLVTLSVVGALMWTGQAWAGIPPTTPQTTATGMNSIATTASPGKLYGQLGSKVARSSSDTLVRVIVHLKDQADLSRWPSNDRSGAILKLQAVAARTQPQVISAVQAASSHVSIYQRYWIFNGFAVEAPVYAVQQLAARDDVAYIIEDGTFTLPKLPVADTGRDDPTANWNIYQVNAPQTWALGLSGRAAPLPIWIPV